MEEQAIFIGTRIEVSTSVKGVHSFSVTVRTRGDETDEEVQARSDALVAKLDIKYPAVEA